jgi:GH25 family lysozyme M1 (1,4-beta-N-acetylmuramidase)
MSVDWPIYGVDISNYQQGIDLAQVAREGYEFCVVKASEGPYRDGTSYVNPSYGPQIEAAERAGLLTGAYHYIIETPAGPQVDLFLDTVGDVAGKLVMVDYEAYPNFPELDPTMATLEAFVAELRNRIGDHPILVYAGQGYWESPPPNGSIAHLDVTTWDAFYPLHPQAGLGSVLYEQVKRLGWGERWGGQEPKFWQFSANGRVAGMQIDVNAFSGTRDELYALADAEPPDVKPEPEPVDKPSEEGLYLFVDPADGSLHEREHDPVRRAIVRNPNQTPMANSTFLTDENGLLRHVSLVRRHPRVEVVEVPKPPADAVPSARSATSRSQGTFRSEGKRIADPGSGWYAETYWTHHDWDADVMNLVLKYEAQYDGIYLNTYYYHPPVHGRAWEFRSFDVWDVAGRGWDLDSDLGNEIWWTIFNDPEPPAIAWIIYKGEHWDPWDGPVSWDLQPDDGSDFGHWRHIHVTFAY